MLNRDELHRTYGGRIYEGDFDPVNKPYKSMSGYSSRIISDFNFDRHCKKNIDIKVGVTA